MFAVAKEQETGPKWAQEYKTDMPALAWLLVCAVGSALAGLVITGVVAGRLGLPIAPALLLGGGLLGALPRLIVVMRRRWQADLASLTLALLACAIVSGFGLWLAWPSLLPLGRSVDAVHQYQLVRWISVEQRLPPLDGATRGLLGEMTAYPPGFAFVVAAMSALVRQPPLEALYPTVALLGGLCAALVALLAVATAGVRSWRIVVPGLAGVWLLLAHRAYFLEAYIDHSYYAMVLGLVFVLLACAWPICEPRMSAPGAFQLGLVLAALLATYPLWLPIPALFAFLALSRHVGCTATARSGAKRLVALSHDHLIMFAPVLALALLDLPARMRTGQTVLEHQGLVTLPTWSNLAPVLLALPGAALLLRRSTRADRPLGLLVVALMTLIGMGVLALGAQLGLIAVYHSYKLLFVLVPLAAAVASAAAIRLTTIRLPLLRRVAYLAGALLIMLPGAGSALPVHAEQIPSANLVRAARWLMAHEPDAAAHALLVGAPAGPASYWLQVALLDQRRDRADMAMRAFTVVPPTPESWAIDTQLSAAAIAPNLAAPPPGAEIAAQFGDVAVLRRMPLDAQAVNPLIVRYTSFWEENRLKTAIELVRPVAGPLPLLELRLLHNGALVNTFALQPNMERTKPQYLGADLLPDTLGGRGYVNADAYPTFAPPAAAPVGGYMLTLRLSFAGAPLDERLLATFDRMQSGVFANLAVHSGELDYLRRPISATAYRAADARFGSIRLSGWQQQPASPGSVAFMLRWNGLHLLQQSFSTQLCAVDPAGHVVACSRGLPQSGFYPTWRWREGEDVVERRELALPPDLPAGTYTLVAGVFDQATQQELAPTSGNAKLGEVVVEKRHDA